MRHLKTLLRPQSSLAEHLQLARVGVLGPAGALVLATAFFLILAALMVHL